MINAFENERFLYIVMEECVDGELFEHIKNNQLREREVSVIMYQLIEAIHYLQMSGIVHRDLKPENILIEKDPESDEVLHVKVTDFGLSKIVLPKETMMECCGTPAYVAPEVLLKNGYGN